MTSNKIVIGLGIISVLALVGVFRLSQTESPGSLAEQSNQPEAAPTKILEAKVDEQGGVTVTVRPMILLASAPFWTFEVALNTHAGQLAEDLAASAFLIDDVGKVHAATSWAGDPPGGHHRRGELKFKALEPLPAQLRLKLVNVGGVAERMFIWETGWSSQSALFTVPEREYDFGVVKQSGGVIQHQFTLTYNGDEPLKVVGVPTSCSCTSAAIDKQVLQKGDNATVTVAFDPNLHEEPAGKFFKTIRLLTEPAVPDLPEWKIWVEIDLDLGSDAYRLKAHRD